MSLSDWIEDQAKDAFPIHCLANILKEMKNLEDSMLGLLHVICERHPPIAYEVEEVYKPELFQLSCPCIKRSHSVSHMGFLLLETVESTMGSATQQVEKVRIDRMEGRWLSDLGSRVTSQQRAVKEVFSPIIGPSLHPFLSFLQKVDAYGLTCSGTRDVEFFLAIVQNSKRATLKQVVVDVQGTIGAEGWAKMAKACTRLGLRSFYATRKCMVEAKRGDLKTVWDALATDGYWYVWKVLIDGTLRDIRTWWEKEGKWKGLQVEIKPLSMVLLNVHHMIIL